RGHRSAVGAAGDRAVGGPGLRGPVGARPDEGGRPGRRPLRGAGGAGRDGKGSGGRARHGVGRAGRGPPDPGRGLAPRTAGPKNRRLRTGGSRLVSMRTHYAGSLRASDEGTEVALCGWVAHRRDHGGVVFIDLRDREGIVQVVLDPASPGCADARRLRSEYVIRVEGTVRRRPEGMVNPKEATGEIEVGASRLEILNEAEPPP